MRHETKFAIDTKRFKPIETRYGGCRFRSRLEARWAVYFDSLNLRWEYEKEGFDFDGLLYLPDFWLPDVRMWAEVKAEDFSFEEIMKLKFLSKFTGHPALKLIGQPEPKSYFAVEWQEEVQAYAEWCDYALSHFHDYPRQEQRFYAGLSDDDLAQFRRGGAFEDACHAAEQAKSARFEYGESGSDDRRAQ